MAIVARLPAPVNDHFVNTIPSALLTLHLFRSAVEFHGAKACDLELVSCIRAIQHAGTRR